MSAASAECRGTGILPVIRPTAFQAVADPGSSDPTASLGVADASYSGSLVRVTGHGLEAHGTIHGLEARATKARATGPIRASCAYLQRCHSNLIIAAHRCRKST